MKLPLFRTSLILCLLSLLGGGTWLAAQNPVIARPIRKKDLIPLSYPQAGIGVGAMRWSDRARDEAKSFKTPEQAFSQAFRAAATPQDIKWEDFQKQRNFTINLSAEPGPQVLEAAKLASGKAGVAFDRNSLNFVKWGRLREASVDLQDLTEACLRGWFNLPGKAMRNEVLFQMRLDETKADRRPWIVSRVVRVEGMQYQLKSNSTNQFDLSAGTAVYGSGSLGLSFKVMNETTLEVTEPMAIAFDAVRLESVEPPLPRLQYLAGKDAVHPTNYFGTFKFTWRYGEGGDRESVEIRTGELWARDARTDPDEEQYPAGQKQALEQEVKAGKPVPLAVIPEVLPEGAKDWKPLGEGDAFPGSALLRLRVLLEAPGYLYMLARDGAGQSAALHPAAPGQTLAKGRDVPITNRVWVYPTDVDGSVGMRFNPQDPPGLESFIVVASRTQLPKLPAAMAEFAKAGNQSARPPSPTRGGFAFPGLLRLPVGFAGGTTATNADSGPVPAIFCGLDTATVVTVGLNRQSVPAKTEGGKAGLRLPVSTSGMLTAEGGGSGASGANGVRIVNTLDYYPSLPAGVYPHIWGVFVGVGEYADRSVGSLENPPGDASQLAAAFVRQAGMQPPVVLTNGDATLARLTEVLTEIGRKDGPGDLFVFHFSGHGIGLDNQSGRMLFHEFNTRPEGDATGSNGMLEMGLLTQLLDRCGIDSKHRLLLLDCCYSGMGARAMTRSALARAVNWSHPPLTVEERQQNALQSLGLKTTYVMTAGGAGQPVLDGGEGAESRHGLLSGYLLSALESPPATAGTEIPLGDRLLLPMRAVFQDAKDQIRTEARRVLSAEFARWKEGPTRQAGRQPSRDGGTLEQVFARVREPADLEKLIQNPQDAVLDGEGEIFLPLLRSTVAGPAVGPTDPGIEPAQAAAMKEPPAGTKAFVAWSKSVGERYGNPSYGQELEHVFQLLMEGRPAAGGAGALAVSAELQMRPRLNGEDFTNTFSPERLSAKYPALAAHPEGYSDLFFLELEHWRDRVKGAQWFGQPYLGGVGSPNYEVRFLLENAGDRPLHYYLIAHDSNGILQWIAPRNDSAPEPDYTFGPGRLEPGIRFGLPLEKQTQGMSVSYGWPIETEADQQYFLVVTREPWSELEVALRPASRAGFLEYAKLEQQRAKGLPSPPIGGALPNPTAGVRAVGKVVQTVPGPPAGPGESGKLETPVILTRNDGACLVFAWHLHILPAGRFHPELAGNAVPL